MEAGGAAAVTVSTVAGAAGQGGHKDGPAHEARFRGPYGVAVAADGSLLVADCGNQCIRRISADGRQVSTVAGAAGQSGYKDGPAHEARFRGPYGVAVAGDGSLLVADNSNQCIRRVSADGRQVSTVAGAAGQRGHKDGPAHEARFSGPTGVAVAGDGSLLVADCGNQCVRRISADGRQVSTAAGAAGQSGYKDGPAHEARFRGPSGVAVAGDGSLLVADCSNQCIRRISADGRQVSTVAGAAGQRGHKDGPAHEARFSCPTGVAVAGDGSLLVADYSNQCIHRISADGRQVSTVAGAAGLREHKDGPAHEARFSCPTGVAVAGDGSLLVADCSNHCIRRVEGLGIVPPGSPLAAPTGLPEPEPQTRPIPEAVTPAVPPLQQLCAMGHAREAAQAALAACSGDLGQAARSLQQAASQAAVEDAVRQEKALSVALLQQQQVEAAAAVARAESAALLAKQEAAVAKAEAEAIAAASARQQAGPTIESWLGEQELSEYAEAMKQQGYTSLRFLRDSEVQDLDELGQDIAMKKPHLRTLKRAWKKLVADQGSEAAATPQTPGHDSDAATAAAAPEPEPVAADTPSESHGQTVQVMQPSDEFDFVFSNKTASDALCLTIRAKLTAQGLRVWQQKTNIPKDSDNWFNEWFPSAVKSRKIVCFLTVEYLKSPYCMKEFGIALASHKLLVVACEPLAHIRAVDPSAYPYASNALAYLLGGGQVIFHDTEDVVAEILKFAQ